MISQARRDSLRVQIDSDATPTLHRLIATTECIANNNPYGLPLQTIDGPFVVPPHPMAQLTLGLELIHRKCNLDNRELTGLAARAHAHTTMYQSVLKSAGMASGAPPSVPFQADHLFLGCKDLATLVNGARALENTVAGNMIAPSHMQAISELFYDLGCERLDRVVAFIRRGEAMEPGTRRFLDIGRMPFQPGSGISPLEWGYCRDMVRALDLCGREVPGSPGFYAALGTIIVMSDRVWDSLAEQTINSSIYAIAEFLRYMPDIANDIRNATGRDLIASSVT